MFAHPSLDLLVARLGVCGGPAAVGVRVRIRIMTRARVTVTVRVAVRNCGFESGWYCGHVVVLFHALFSPGIRFGRGSGLCHKVYSHIYAGPG